LLFLYELYVRGIFCSILSALISYHPDALNFGGCGNYSSCNPRIGGG